MGLLSRLFQGRAAAPAPGARVAAFGKHPGWDDHLDDYGLDSEALVEVKRRLYVEGIGRNIDSGAWERLAPGARIAGFGHVFVWSFPGSRVVGRLWASSDRKGRSRYPMVVCVEVVGPGELSGAAVGEIDARLAALEGVCRGTQDRGAVVAALGELGAWAEGRLGAWVVGGAESAGEALARLAGRAELGPDNVGFLRAMYELARVSAPRLSGGSGGAPEGVSQHLRVPACGEGAAGVALWVAGVRELVGERAAVLAVRPLEQGWADVVVGAATAEHVFGLLASPEAVPLATDIPYTLDERFIGSVRKMLGNPRLGIAAGAV